jgi:hypothetical protein
VTAWPDRKNKGVDGFSPDIIRSADDAYLTYRRMLVEDSFDLLWGDIASAADDDLFPTSYEPMEAVCIATD